MSDESQTHKSFSEKWSKNPGLVVAETLDPNSEFQKWILERNGFNSRREAEEYLSAFETILDAGCGNGRVTALLADLNKTGKIYGMDLVDLGPAISNTSGFSNVKGFVNADLTQSLKEFGPYDFIYCQEVLHHTADPKQSFLNLTEILTSNGEIAIYVYKQKAPAREFMDDHVRSEISGRDYEEAMRVCEQIAHLGRDLSNLEGEITTQAIPEIGVQAGTYSIQRFIYHFFMKCYWNDSLSSHENAVVNYDWYHPLKCSRHTIAEVLRWFSDANLEIVWEYQDMYGITVRGRRK